MVVRTAQEAHLRPLQKRPLRLRPRPCRKEDRCNSGLRAPRRRVHQKMADLSFRDRLQMFAQCINCPTALILRGIKCWPRRLDKVDEASFEPQRLRVVAPECGCCLKFSAPGANELEEAAIHRIPPVALCGLRAKAAQPT